MNSVDDLHGGITGLWNLIGFDAPHFSDMTPRFGIADGALTRQLIALLTMFASALPVALSGNHHASGTFTADVAGSQA